MVGLVARTSMIVVPRSLEPGIVVFFLSDISELVLERTVDGMVRGGHSMVKAALAICSNHKREPLQMLSFSGQASSAAILGSRRYVLLFHLVLLIMNVTLYSLPSFL